jgi:hypothetical protein
MTNAQLDRLPGVLFEIVLIDRRLSESVIEIEDIRTRRRLREGATALYGYRLSGDDATAKSSRFASQNLPSLWSSHGS